MTWSWEPSDIGADPDDYTAGQVPVKDDDTGLFVPGEMAVGDGGVGLIDVDTTVTVGSGGDFATINAALEDLMVNRADYVPEDGRLVEVKLLSGFEMAEQVLVRRQNLGWIVVTAEDATVTIVRSALTVNFAPPREEALPAGSSVFPAWGGRDGAVLPVIDVLFDMDSSGSATARDGFAVFGSRLTILNGRGCRNAGRDGLEVQDGSVVNALETDFSGAGVSGIHVNSSLVEARGVDCSDCGLRGIDAGSNAFVNARQADCSGAGDRAVRASNGGILVVFGADLSGASNYGISCTTGGKAEARQADCSGAGLRGILCQYGGWVNISDGNARKGGSNSPQDMQVDFGSVIIAHDATGGTSQTKNLLTGAGMILDGTAANVGTGSFTGLGDTPSSYSGQGGKLLAVNSGESAVEFVTGGGGGGSGALTWDGGDATGATGLVTFDGGGA